MRRCAGDGLVFWTAERVKWRWSLRDAKPCAWLRGARLTARDRGCGSWSVARRGQVAGSRPACDPAGACVGEKHKMLRVTASDSVGFVPAHVRCCRSCLSQGLWPPTSDNALYVKRAMGTYHAICAIVPITCCSSFALRGSAPWVRALQVVASSCRSAGAPGSPPPSPSRFRFEARKGGGV